MPTTRGRALSGGLGMRPLLACSVRPLPRAAARPQRGRALRVDRRNWEETHPMQHLVIDAFVDDATTIGQVEPIFNLLNDLPEQIEMTKITQPYVFRYSGVVPEDWGVTGMVIIAESHISIHTFPEHKRFHMDVFSCKPFDYERTLAIIEQKLGVTRRAADVIRRPVVGEEIAEAGEMRWRVTNMPEGVTDAAKAEDARVRQLLGTV
jgi:S-adenosylmethionine decarboxylase